MKYMESIGKNWSHIGGGFTEHHKSLYFSLFRRTIRLSWVWAIDSFGRRGYTPFRTKMNYTAFVWYLGYFRIHINEKRRRTNGLSNTTKLL